MAIRGLLGGLLLLAVVGCTAAPPCRNHTQLFFGMAIGDSGQRMDEAAWRAFVEAAILPRFPDGFTIVEAEGLWRSPATGRAVGEPSRILLVLHADTADSHGRLDAIAAEYRMRFPQDSVLRLDHCAAYGF